MQHVLLAAGASDPGRQHRRNEDAWSITELDGGFRLLLVCDGMGGMGRGDEASRLAVETIVAAIRRSTLPPPARLQAALEAADREIVDRLCTEALRPGSTAVAVLVREDAAWVAWIGDSRAYWIRGARIVARTTDHKVVQGLVDAGQLTAEEARRSALSNVLSQSLGGRVDGRAIEVGVMAEPWRLLPGDRVLLCTDGIVDLVRDEEIPDRLGHLAPERAAVDLVNLANERGGHDNATAIVAAWASAAEAAAIVAATPAPPPDAPTEGFAPSREIWPDDGACLEDEDDRATVLGGPAHELLRAELLPPTPPPSASRDAAPPAPTPLPAYPPLNATRSGPPSTREAQGSGRGMMIAAVALLVVALVSLALAAYVRG